MKCLFSSNTPLGIQHAFSNKFYIGQNNSKMLFLYGRKLRCLISFDIFLILQTFTLFRLVRSLEVWKEWKVLQLHNPVGFEKLQLKIIEIGFFLF